MSETELVLRKEGALARLVIDRPAARNAMSTAMWRLLPELVRDAIVDPAVKVLIVQGASDTAFAAGADIAEVDECIGDDARAAALMDGVHAAEHALATCPKPVIAMIRGICIGGGIELAPACDLRFASTECTFSVPPARLGVVYSLYSTKRLVHLVGPGRARDLLYRDRRGDGSGGQGVATRPDRERDPGLCRDTVPALTILDSGCQADGRGRPGRAGRRGRGAPPAADCVVRRRRRRRKCPCLSGKAFAFVPLGLDRRLGPQKPGYGLALSSPTRHEERTAF